MPKKWDRCVQKVSQRNVTLPPSKRVNPYAVCTKSVGYKKKK